MDDLVARGEWAPPVDVFEDEREIVLTVEIPGMRKEEIEIKLSDGVITISGERRLEREEQREGYHRIERAYGRFSRCFTLPQSVDQERISASYRDGLLVVKLPKTPEESPRRIPVEIE